MVDKLSAELLPTFCIERAFASLQDRDTIRRPEKFIRKPFKFFIILILFGIKTCLYHVMNDDKRPPSCRWNLTQSP